MPSEANLGGFSPAHLHALRLVVLVIFSVTYALIWRFFRRACRDVELEDAEAILKREFEDLDERNRSTLSQTKHNDVST